MCVLCVPQLPLIRQSWTIPDLPDTLGRCPRYNIQVLEGPVLVCPAMLCHGHATLCGFSHSGEPRVCRGCVAISTLKTGVASGYWSWYSLLYHGMATLYYQGPLTSGQRPALLHLVLAWPRYNMSFPRVWGTSRPSSLFWNCGKRFCAMPGLLFNAMSCYSHYLCVARSSLIFSFAKQ
eukprot:9486969-Pyramimonas_sp.AAC.1